MRSTELRSSPTKAGLVIGILLAAHTLAHADSTVTLTAAPTHTTLPDGQSVPMWGLMCGTFSGTTFTYDGGAITGSTVKPCTTLAGGAHDGSWQPPLITVPSGGSLTITLRNALSFGTTYQAPTSLVIVGQLGGGLGGAPMRMPSPPHSPQGTTWPGTLGGTGPDDPVFTPPAQADRVRSFATEVAAGSSQSLVWTAANLRPGTYLLQSGTQPSIQGPMGLYGVIVVTDASYPGQPFDKDVALLLSEVDPVQNQSVDTAVRTTGFSDTRVWNGQTGQCGEPSVHTCYPPAVNYDPRYFLVNGASFDRSSSSSPLSAVPASATSGNVLLRFVNAGSRMHVPSVVGADMTLLAEDGYKLPGVPKVQSQLFLPAGKTHDVTIHPAQATATSADCSTLPCYAPATYPVFDRALNLSTNNQRDGGMQAYIQVAGGAASGGVGSPGSAVSAVARPDTYFLVAGNALSVTEIAKGAIANDTGVYGVTLLAGPSGSGSSLKLNADGTFLYTPGASVTSDAFTYCANGVVDATTCSSGITAAVTLAACTGSCLGGRPMANADVYTSKIASRVQINPPGVLSNDVDPSAFPLKATLVAGSVSGGAVTLNADGSFIATPSCAPACTGTPPPVTFQYTAMNSQNTSSTPVAVTTNFAAARNLTVNVKDAKSGDAITDYRWIIEEDRTVFIDPAHETTGSATPVTNVAVNFHTSHMPVVAQGCTGPLSCESGQTMLDPSTGTHVPAVCDIGNGTCRPGDNKTIVLPSEVALDPAKRYYISVLPGDGADGGHGMGGGHIAAGVTSINVGLQPLPNPPAKISVFVFQDDHPLNGENDTGGGIGLLAPNEAGLGGFHIVLLDKTGQFGDAAGQLTYDEFGQPVSNSLAGTIDPATGLNACPISPKSADGLVGMIVTCPKFEANPDGSASTVLSPLAGHAVIANMYPGLYEVHATPGSDRVARGEEWLQTNTLDGTKDIEAFIKPDEPAYFQEFGPGGYHVAVGFANPAIINGRKGASGDGKGLVCSNQACTATINGRVTSARLSRTPDQRVYSSGSYDAYSFANCYVSLGAPDSADFAFTKCDAEGNFTFTNVPQGNMKVTVFDQWNDLLVDGLSTPVKVDGQTIGTPESPLEIPVTQWRTNLYGRIFIDVSGNGVPDKDADGNDLEPGLPLAPYNIRYRDGSYMGFNNTDLAGYAGFNEVFPFLNWLVVDTDSARYKQSGVHVVYDAGGPADGTTGGGGSQLAAGLANTIESTTAHVPAGLRVPGATYCADADCTSGATFSPENGNAGSTGRIDPGWVPSEGWQGLLGNNSFVEFAMSQFAPNENGGIKGHVIYTSTRPFDDPQLLLQLSWEPGVPNVRVNLYRQGTAQDGTKSLQLVDTTMTSSFDDWAQGFRRDANGSIVLAGGSAVPNMSCPGQEVDSPFYYTMENSPMPLNPTTPLAANSRFKCYDGWSMLNQVQPTPYNGMYKFPSVVAKSGPTRQLPASDEALHLQFDPSTYKTNCTICTANPVNGAPMLPPGKYVVEVVVPEGYELVKEEDKNILLGDAFIAPVTQQFAGFGNIFIMPDQAAVNAAYNPYNPVQSTVNNGAVPRHEGDTGSVETFWPCVGAARIVPDFNSLFPGAEQAAPFAGATRPLCDRKEVTLSDQMTVLAKFYVFTSAHVSGHYTGIITNDFASEFDPFSPQFGEKFAVPNVPVAFRDFTGKEISRVYADQWGAFNGLTYSTWTVNPPSPSGYIPQMMLACMNDPGPIPDPAHPGQKITDPAYNPAYSNFCYEWPFMPGQTAYLDTPVLPTMAFADRYNLPDCEYPDTTPAIKSVTGSVIPASNGHSSGAGPWVSAPGQSLTITALGDRPVINHAYSGPRASNVPFNNKFITRHYGFGACTLSSGACTNGAKVTIGGIAGTIVSWTDSQIVVTVPATVPLCSIQQRGVTAQARCGELEITAANGKKSIDAVTVTIGGKTPIYVTPDSPSSVLFGRIQPSPLQTAIDNAVPGDLIVVGPGTYKENLLMWKPVRLQGVGAESVTINADAHPAGKLDAWRRQVNCLFGLSLNGRPLLSDGTFPAQPYDPTGTYQCPSSMRQRIDRLPFEAIVGWDALGNGNLAEMLQEPTLMGAYEGAGVTALGRGIRIPATSNDFWGAATGGGYPANYQYLSNGNADCTASTTRTDGRDYGTSNFLCNPSSVDGLSVINSSQGGGAIWLHAWNHNMEVANTRVHGNHGTLSGGITVGNGEFPIPYIVGGTNPPPANLPAAGLLTGQQAGYGFNRNVKVHHNAVTSNLSVGDALYSGTPSAAGGVSICTGSDSYKFNNNWICGNMSTGDAGGVAHSGFSNNGTIASNWVLFNQSFSATLPTNGGGIGVLGASPDNTITSGPNAGLECGTVDDLDCPPGLAEGTGRNLLIDANLIMGNSAESGTGGGLRLQLVNGQDVAAFPLLPIFWNDVTVTNNIIANNVAGWDGGGVSLQDALRVQFVNNTVISNDTTASAGVLFNTLGAPLSSVPPPGCTPNTDPTAPQNPNCDHPVITSTNQAAGFATMRNTPNMDAALLDLNVICPLGFGYDSLLNGTCRRVSLPLLVNNVFWQNRAFHVEVGDLGVGQQNQQKVVTLVPSLNQAATGVCTSLGTGNGAPGSDGPVNYWDLGVRGDTGPTDHSSGYRLTPRFSILTGGDYSGNSNLVGANPAVIRQYCNGSRLPPEGGGPFAGYSAPPGRSETTGLYPVFALNQITPAATVDEGNNWINLSYGPLSLSNASAYTVPNTPLAPLGNYSIAPSSPAVNEGLGTFLGIRVAPDHDFFGAPRPQSAVDIGAVEVPGPMVDLRIVKDDGVTNVFRGGTVTYTITVTNSGQNNILGALVADARPAALSSWSWSCAPTGLLQPCGLLGNSGTGNINKALGILAPGASATFTVTGIVSSSAAAGNFTNTATVTAPAGVTDQIPANNTMSDTDTVVVGTGSVSFLSASGGGATLSGSTLNFGSQNGAIHNSTVTLRVGAAPVTFGAAVVTNSAGTAFSLVGGNCAGQIVAANGSCTITVNFDGGTNDLLIRNGTLTVSSNAASSPQVLTLTGR